MSSDNRSKSIKTLCDDTQLRIAELLPDLAKIVGEKALGAEGIDGSLAHAKFLIELAEFLHLGPVEKKTKLADEQSAATAAAIEDSLRQRLIDTLESMRVKEPGNEPKHNSSAVK